MQPNATRPVMDVARRPSSPQPARMAVRPAPRVPQQPQPDITKATPQIQDATIPTEQPKPQAKPTAQPVSKPTAPVGIIVVALMVMMVLITLAVIIYLTS